MNGALLASKQTTTATSSSTDAELNKRNRRSSLKQVVPSLLVGVDCYLDIVEGQVLIIYYFFFDSTDAEHL